MGVIRYGTDHVVALLDSSIAGRNVARVAARARHSRGRLRRGGADAPRAPDTLLIGIAPTGGRLPAEWRATILEAIDAGLDIHSGLHTFLGDDPEFAAAASASGVRDRGLPAAP